METILNDIHLSSEALEEYVRGQLTESAVMRINDHLLECDSCNARYEQEAQLLISLRRAATAAPLKSERALLPFWFRIPVMPNPLMAAALTVVLAFLLVPRLSNFSASPAVAELTAFRNAGLQTAPANRPLLLRLDTSGLDPARHLRAEVADSGGNSVWSGSAAIQAGRLEVSVDRRLSAGQYWVRLYAGNESDCLREFSLHLK